MSRNTTLVLLSAALALLWSLTHRQAFIGLWLTPDQQGQLLFRYGAYERAAQVFEDPRWRAMSLYGAEDFAAAELAFSQYQDAESLLAQGNALAHAREYLDARATYEELQRRYPEHPAPAVNLPIVQELIDANRLLSESQASEPGDSVSDEEGGPRSSEGDERLVNVEREQLSAEELMGDPALTALWLRQVQRNPSEFLATKFYLQLEQREGRSP